ncbi:MAG: hypothetical protein U0935_15270 [Pirellulales bacterium]
MATADSAFTRHVRYFGTADDDAQAAVEALRLLLKRRLKRRGLQLQPPSYLGYSGPDWRDEGTFEELLFDCYSYVFVQRIIGLRNQARVRWQIDGLITLNVDHFLTERQQRHDPIGYAMFGNVRAALKQGEKEGQWSCDPSSVDQEVANTTVVWRTGKREPTCWTRDQLLARLESEASWPEAVPSLVKCSKQGQAWVKAFLVRLWQSDSAPVRVGELVATLAGLAREVWRIRHALPPSATAFEGDEEFGQVVRVLTDDESTDERDRWEWLTGRIEKALEESPLQARRRTKLLEEFAWLSQVVERHDIPSQAQLCQELGIARTTASDDFRILREIIERIRRDDNNRSSPSPNR